MNSFKSLSNNLTISVDWISFTISDEYCVDDIIQFMGFAPKQFRYMPKGAHGYKKQLKFENISILYDGAENMGIHVDVSGSSVTTLLESYNETLFEDTVFGKSRFVESWEETTLSRFCSEILKIGHFTRIDLAVDDFGTQYYSTDDIISKRSNGQIISKWKSTRNLEENSIYGNIKVGHTIYFGSTQSEIQLRIYDKQLEQNKGLTPNDENYINEKWTRWELQSRNKRADGIAIHIANRISLGEVAIGILSNYIRIVILDDCNKSRCSAEEPWANFISNISKLKITLPKIEKSFDEKIKQFEKQQGRTIAKIYNHLDGDIGYFGDLARRYECKLTSQDCLELGFEDY